MSLRDAIKQASRHAAPDDQRYLTEKVFRLAGYTEESLDSLESEEAARLAMDNIVLHAYMLGCTDTLIREGWAT